MTITFKTNSEDSWWKKGIIYQIYPRSFKDNNCDGVGDLKGIISKLDYLEWLAIDAIWLSPIFSSPMEDFGYDVSNYTEIHPLFGTLDEFDELINEAHKRNIKILLDYVINHSSDQHPWFKESRLSLSNSKKDWYIWKNPKSDGSPPNNWISLDQGSAWTFEKSRNQYYLHSFLPCQPDLNWRNPEVREEMSNVLKFWMDRGVDGFRIDMISWIIKDEDFRDDPISESYNPKTNTPYEKLEHVHSSNRPERFDILKEIRSTIDEYPNRVSIGEVNYFTPLDKLIKYYGEENNLIIDLPVNFRILYLPWKASIIKDFVDSYDNLLPKYAWPNYQIGNHDRPRVVSRIGEQQAKMAAMLLLTLRGTPFIYNGEEIGMHNIEIQSEKMQDPLEHKQHGFGRDPFRTPMQWDSSKFAGFSEEKPWLPISEDYEIINVDKQMNDPFSFLTLYKRLIELRRKYSTLSLGNYKSEKLKNNSCFVYNRIFKRNHCLIALNFSNSEQSLEIVKIKGKKILLSTYLDRQEELGSNILVLRPNEGCIIIISN
ncbi:MAG: Oligo-1,6-glucosidase [Candidatus Heimdallarchaeota archaeon LC_3]|nr:MAG: Oligo-1,6-glucosidase [Candidatus Heimdallarchaeota archaeon LC_3]